ncbi:MAG: hypothetical protein COB15_04590 [Flavobacteriales bacterium]|nr:MAG: hypothetical protein COB15_04590 [Flavobacteriales bacterium]
MKTIPQSDLIKISNSSNPKLKIHLEIIELFKQFGYDNTQEIIGKTLDLWENKNDSEVKDYLLKRLDDQNRLKPFLNDLFKILLRLDYEELESWGEKSINSDLSRKHICDILSELIVFLQYHPETKEDEKYFDFIADYADRYSGWGGNQIYTNDSNNENKSG